MMNSRKLPNSRMIKGLCVRLYMNAFYDRKEIGEAFILLE